MPSKEKVTNKIHMHINFAESECSKIVQYA